MMPLNALQLKAAKIGHLLASHNAPYVEYGEGKSVDDSDGNVVAAAVETCEEMVIVESQQEHHLHEMNFCVLPSTLVAERFGAVADIGSDGVTMSTHFEANHTSKHRCYLW
jgi:hypothetical protein